MLALGLFVVLHLVTNIAGDNDVIATIRGHFPFHRSQLDLQIFGIAGPTRLWARYYSKKDLNWLISTKIKSTSWIYPSLSSYNAIEIYSNNILSCRILPKTPITRKIYSIYSGNHSMKC